ncbi:MAG: RluA family pseudouridine synthase [Actinobacteria bacterium]|nr:RluA family pseudouridine synthase [Actinomycetota bacterium]
MGGGDVVATAVPPALDGVRLDRALAVITGVSRSQASQAVKDGAVLVDGRVVRAIQRRLHAGERIEVELACRSDEAAPLADPKVRFQVVYQDEHIVVVDKPAGLVVHPGHGNPGGTLVNGLIARYPDLASGDIGSPERPGIVHRLDKGTSGLLVVARTPKAYNSLVGQIKARKVERRYLALLWGALGDAEGDSGIVDAPIGRSVRAPTSMAVTLRGRPARTRYTVLRKWTLPMVATLVQAELESGRTHQIRVHFAAIGHGVVGDQRYKGFRESKASPPDETRGAKPQEGPPASHCRNEPAWPNINRPFLHSFRLSLDHPATGERMTWETTLPDDLQEALAVLERA